MLKSSYPALLAAALLLPAATAQTIVDVAVGSPDHTTLVAAVTQAGLVDVLSGAGPFTVFAPINSAFESIDPKYLEDEWAAHLVDILTYHVAAGQVGSADLALDAVVDMVNMESANITSLEPPMINQATIVAADLMATNGVVHVIDEVLLPESAINSIADLVASSGNFTILGDLLNMTGLIGTLMGEGPFTVFAPTDAAFDALDNATATYLLSPEGLEDLTDILLYHVSSGILLSDFAEDGDMEMINGDDIMVTLPGMSNVTIMNETAVNLSMDTIMINGASVISADNLANNGVIHVIDSVLIPPSEVDAEDDKEEDDKEEDDKEVDDEEEEVEPVEDDKEVDIEEEEDEPEEDDKEVDIEEEDELEEVEEEEDDKEVDIEEEDELEEVEEEEDDKEEAEPEEVEEDEDDKEEDDKEEDAKEEDDKEDDADIMD